MSCANKFLSLDGSLYEYVVGHGHNRDPLLAELAEETRKLGWIAQMQIAPEQGTLMSILARVSGARRAIEIGTFTGYSAICVARGLPDDGKLLCLDVNEEWTSLARRYWERAGLTGKITLKLGPAADTLRAMAPAESFDFAFIDADKTNYHLYYEEILKRMPRDGLILFDNVLWNGRVTDAKDQSEDTRAIRQLNDFVATDSRVEAVMIPVADGLTIVRKR